VNDGGGNGASCVGIKVRTDTAKLSDMVIARFGDGRNLIREGKMFSSCNASIAARCKNRYIFGRWIPFLRLKPPKEDLRKMSPGCQPMPKVLNGVETLPKISTG